MAFFNQGAGSFRETRRTFPRDTPHRGARCAASRKGRARQAFQQPHHTRLRRWRIWGMMASRAERPCLSRGPRRSVLAIVLRRSVICAALTASAFHGLFIWRRRGGRPSRCPGRRRRWARGCGRRRRWPARRRREWRALRSFPVASRNFPYSPPIFPKTKNPRESLMSRGFPMVGGDGLEPPTA